MRNLTVNLGRGPKEGDGEGNAREVALIDSNLSEVRPKAALPDAHEASITPNVAAANIATATPIDNPDQAYQANTTKIDISGLTFGDLYSSISDDQLTVTFSVPLVKAGPVPTGWATWSSPPFSEDANPDVLYSETNTLEMVLSRPVRIFGFELEPAPFGAFMFTADFFRGNQLVESITRTVDGNNGARLFARTGSLVDRVLVTGPSDFAIAQVRYQLPINALLIALIVILIILIIWLLL